jgi:hypothetical protein
MTLANDRLGRWPGSRPAGGPQFGSSSRTPMRTRSLFDRLFDPDDDSRGWGGTYRTLCVRLCDGYYFPVSFAVTPERFGRDADVCRSSCGAQGRLFIYRNPGGIIEDMEDLSGRPYRQLRTAFLYRTQYVADCRCQPHPWETAAQDRHRAYALAAARRRGDGQAARELEELQRRQAANAATAAAGQALREDAGAVPGRTAAAPDERSLMRLGAEGAPKPAPAPQPRASREWSERVLRGNSGF